MHLSAFSTVRFQMSPQIGWLRRCIVSLDAFVWLFSIVCFQMYPQITWPTGCKFTLAAIVWLNVSFCLFILDIWRAFAEITNPFTLFHLHLQCVRLDGCLKLRQLRIENKLGWGGGKWKWNTFLGRHSHKQKRKNKWSSVIANSKLETCEYTLGKWSIMLLQIQSFVIADSKFRDLRMRG